VVHLSVAVFEAQERPWLATTKQQVQKEGGTRQASTKCMRSSTPQNVFRNDRGGDRPQQQQTGTVPALAKARTPRAVAQAEFKSTLVTTPRATVHVVVVAKLHAQMWARCRL
jgi:hypothetical protein